MSFADNNGTNTTMLVQPTGYGNGNSGWGNGFGGPIESLQIRQFSF